MSDDKQAVSAGVRTQTFKEFARDLMEDPAFREEFQEFARRNPDNPSVKKMKRELPEYF